MKRLRHGSKRQTIVQFVNFFNSISLDSFIIYSPGGLWKRDGGRGVIISVFKVFICLIRRVLLTSERGPLYRYPSRLIYWCIYSELSIVGLLWKKGVLYLFVSYQGYYKRVFLIGHWLVLALMVRVRDY